MQRIKELDGLRALAIGAVLLVHFRPVHHPVFNWMAFGWAGVDLFFVISGFLITGILWNLRHHPSPFREFYRRRTLRIFPPYYLALCLILISARLHGESIPSREQFENWFFLSSLKGLSLNLMASRLFLRTGFSNAPLALDFHRLVLFERGLRVFWSLSVEELFYLFWAPVVLKGSKRFIIFCSITPLFVCPAIRGFSHTATFMETGNFFARFDSLAAGACLALLLIGVKRGPIPIRVVDRVAWIVMPVSAVAIVLLAWWCGAFRSIQVKSTLAFAVLGYSLIAAFCASVVAVCVRWSDTRLTEVIRFQPLVYLGSISYMMYLVHLPVYVAIGILLARLGLLHHIEAVQGTLAVGLTVVFSASSWKYFESPILRFKDRTSVVFDRKLPSRPEVQSVPLGSCLQIKAAHGNGSGQHPSRPVENAVLHPPLAALSMLKRGRQHITRP